MTFSRRRLLLLSGGLGATMASAFAGLPVAAAEARTSSGPDTVSLTYSGSRLHGTYGRHQLNLNFNQHSAGITGTVAGKPTNLHLQTGDNSVSTQVPASLRGSFDKERVSILGTFQLAPSYLFESGSVSGEVGRDPIKAQVIPASGSSSSSVEVTGSYGASKFQLHGEIAGDLSGGMVKGTVGGAPIHLVAQQSQGTHRIVGSYAGPPGLLGLIVGSLLYFL